MATLKSLAVFLVVVLGLAAASAVFATRGEFHHDGWDFAWGEEVGADDAAHGWEHRWGSGFAPGEGAFQHGASSSGDGKSYSFSWSSDDAGKVHGGASFAGNWKPEKESGGAKAEK